MTVLSGMRRQRSKRRRGAVMVEFAIVLPIFILVIIGIIEFGRAVMVQQILVNAAREGARQAIVPNTTNADVELLVNNYLENAGLGAPSLSISILGADDSALDLADANPRDVIKVVVALPYNEVGVGISSYFSGRTLGAVVQMRKE